ncbi:MAG TPA: COX15/CtaA family protein [Tepidisphaeraceae bacterium]|jgi:cytochrome c oxidase assembly protein subunit 15
MPLDYATPADPQPAYRRGLFAAAFALVASVFPLIWMGGLVTSHGVGLSVPDWPNSYGYNMFLFPPSRWLGGIFYEHTHRLLGTLSGFLAIWLMLMAWGPARTAGGRRGWTIAAGSLWLITVLSGVFTFLAVRQHWVSDTLARLLPHLGVGFASLALVATVAAFCRSRESRRWVRWLTVGVLVAVCVQGTFGGLRVEKVSLTLAIIHGCFAQFFFCLAGFAALVTSKWWLGTLGRVQDVAIGQRALLLAAVTTLVIFGQLIAGALMRHNGAGLAVPGVLVYGDWLPPTDAAGLEAINATRAWSQHLPPVTLTQIWLHLSHRIGAVVVTICVLLTSGYVLQKMGLARAAGRVSVILLGLLATQATLGVLTVYLRKPADIASLHVAVGALTLLTAALSTAVLARQYGRWPARAKAGRATNRLTPAGTVAV